MVSLEMETELLILKEGRIHNLPIRGIESDEEITYMISNGMIADMEKYGMQFSVDNIPLSLEEDTTVVRSIHENPSTRSSLISYVTSIFDVTERQVLTAIGSADDAAFADIIKNMPHRGWSVIDIYPILRSLSSIPHIPIHTIATKKSTKDERIFSLFPRSARGDILVIVDTLSIDGISSLSNIREMVNPGGVIVVMETDYREEDKDLLYAKMIVDKAASLINTDRRWYKPRYEWHNILEEIGLIHMYTQYTTSPFNTYVSIYMFMEDLPLQLERTYAIPNVMKRVSDIFPLEEGVLPNLTLNVNYSIDDLYSLENPVTDDAHAIYTIIRKKSRSTPSLFIDGGGIGTILLAFSKYNKVSIRTDRVQETLDNLLLYKKGRVRREGQSYILTYGQREVTISRSPPLLPASVIITTRPSEEYKDSLYKVVRYNLGTRAMEGERHDLKAETIYVVDSGIRLYPERELLRLHLIERMYNIFAQLVPRGDFRRYLFDIITMGQERGVLLDPVIPATSSIITPDSLVEMVAAVPSEWIRFVEMMRKDYPNYWESNSKEIASILPFQAERRRLAMAKFKDYLSESSVASIASSLHTQAMTQLQLYNDTIGKDIKVHVEVSNGVMKVTANTELIQVVGNRTITFNVTPQMIEGRKYTDVATMLLRHHILDGSGTTSIVEAVQLFGSPLSHMPTWRSIYPDIDMTWGSSGIWMEEGGDIFLNPPYWNEVMTRIVTQGGERKIFVPRVYADRVRGMMVTLV